jgi:polyisoprenoid-binding protein YceI
MNKKYSTILRLTIAVIVITSLTGRAFAQSPSSAPKPPKASYQLTIDGTATMVGNWVCGGDANVQAKPSDASEPVPGLEVGVQTVVVTASVPDIDCGDSTMNKHLRKALKDKEFPEIRYQALKYTLVDEGKAVQTSGELTIAGVTKPVDLGAKLIPIPDGGTRVVGKVEIDMTDFGVKPPSVFFGTLKVAKVVTVKFDTVVRLPHELTQALFINR